MVLTLSKQLDLDKYAFFSLRIKTLLLNIFVLKHALMATLISSAITKVRIAVLFVIIALSLTTIMMIVIIKLVVGTIIIKVIMIKTGTKHDFNTSARQDKPGEPIKLTPRL